MFVRKKLVMLDTTTTTMTTATTTTTTATLSLMTDHALLIGSNNIYYFGWSNSSEHNSAARLIIFRCCFVTFFYGGIFFLSSLRSWWHCFVSWKKYSPIKRVYSGVILKHWRAADRGLMIWKKRIRKHIWTQSVLFRAEVFLIKLQLTSSIWSEAYSPVTSSWWVGKARGPRFFHSTLYKGRGKPKNPASAAHLVISFWARPISCASYGRHTYWLGPRSWSWLDSFGLAAQSRLSMMGQVNTRPEGWLLLAWDTPDGCVAYRRLAILRSYATRCESAHRFATTSWPRDEQGASQACAMRSRVRRRNLPRRIAASAGGTCPISNAAWSSLASWRLGWCCLPPLLVLDRVGSNRPTTGCMAGLFSIQRILCERTLSPTMAVITAPAVGTVRRRLLHASKSMDLTGRTKRG